MNAERFLIYSLLTFNRADPCFLSHGTFLNDSATGCCDDAL